MELYLDRDCSVGVLGPYAPIALGIKTSLSQVKRLRTDFGVRTQLPGSLPRQWRET